MSTENKIALDLRRYNTPEKLSSLIYDTASLSIEASDSDIPRVNPTFLIKRDEDYVIQPGRDKRDVMEMFTDSDPSTTAALAVREMLLSDNQNDAYVWISPSNPWPETRIQVGVKKKTRSERFTYLQRYDISTTLSPNNCLLYGQLLASMSSEIINLPETPDDLRPLIFKLKIPGGQNPFEYLSGFIELPESDRWPSILDGTADKNKNRAVKVAFTVTESIRSNPSVVYTSPIRYGAYIETRMKAEGFGMNPARFGCGGSNISTTRNIFSSNESLVTNISGKDQFGSLEFSCPHCHKINTRPIGQLIANCQHCGADVTC